MKSGTWTGRLVRCVALAALVAAPAMVIATTGVAGAVDVGSGGTLQTNFEDGNVQLIDLTGNISLSGSTCGQFIRDTVNDLVIDGHGFTISQSSSCEDRIFKQEDIGGLTFQNVTVTGGNDFDRHGGAVKSDGPVAVIDSTFTGNSTRYSDESCNVSVPAPDGVDASDYCADPEGGAIYSKTTVTLSGATISDNHADYAGGGIYSRANVHVTDSTISGNSTGDNGFIYGWYSGGGFLAEGGTDITGSTISDNSAICDYECGGSGGGFLAEGATSVVDSTVSGNTATCNEYCDAIGGGFAGGGLSEMANSASTLSHKGQATAEAVIADPGAVLVENSTISGNSATCDGVSNEGAKAAGYVYYCGEGGGFYSDQSTSVDVNASTIDTNIATTYGGAFSTGCKGCEGDSTTVDMVNSTVTANTSGASGAIDVSGKGETLNLTQDTIVQNVLDEIDTIRAAELPNDGSDPAANISATYLTSFGTIVALPIGGVNCEIWDSVGTEQYNFSDDNSCAFQVSTDDVATPNDPSLLALGDYGGPTQTMRPTGLIEGGVLQSISPVVDRIPAADCVVDVDQRGISRPQTVKSDACDIGAVELTAEEITVSPAEVIVPVAPPVIIQPMFTG